MATNKYTNPLSDTLKRSLLRNEHAGSQPHWFGRQLEAISLPKPVMHFYIVFAKKIVKQHFLSAKCWFFLLKFPHHAWIPFLAPYIGVGTSFPKT